jgi:hypothetical protein
MSKQAEILCSVDGRPVGRGGVKSPPLCARCYQRRRRKLPDTVAPAYDGDRTEKLALKVNPTVAKAVRKEAKRAGLSVSTWLEKAVEARLGFIFSAGQLEVIKAPLLVRGPERVGHAPNAEEREILSGRKVQS